MVSPEDKSAQAWKARVLAERQADDKAKAGGNHELAEDKAVGDAEAVKTEGPVK